MINGTIAGLPVELIEAPRHLWIPCEQCFDAEADFAVGVQDHKLVCEPCLDWGDLRRWWNLEPRQAINRPGVSVALHHDKENDVFTYWVRAA